MIASENRLPHALSVARSATCWVSRLISRTLCGAAMAWCLLITQQGGLAHELSHLSHLNTAAIAAAVVTAHSGEPSPSHEALCEQCRAFAHVGTPAVWSLPSAVLLGDLALPWVDDARAGVAAVALLLPRSRGPPAET